MWRASKLYRQSIVYFLLRGIAKHLNILLGEYPRAINRNLSWKRISVWSNSVFDIVRDLLGNRGIVTIIGIFSTLLFFYLFTF